MRRLRRREHRFRTLLPRIWNPRGLRQGVKRNLRLILREALRAGLPAIIGTAGHAGGRPHLQWAVEIVLELAWENDWRLKLAAIDSEIEPNLLTVKSHLLTPQTIGRLYGVPEVEVRFFEIK